MTTCVTSLFSTPWIAARQASLSITNSRSLLKLMSIKSEMPSPSHPFSSCPQSLTASGSFPMSQLFAWGGQSIRVSASASVLPMNYTVIYINDQVEKISLQIKSQYDKSKYKWLSKKSLMFKLPPMIPNYICVAKNDLYRSLHFHSFCLLRSKRKPHATHVHLKFIFSK